MGLEMAELAARLERSENELLRLASADPSALGAAVDAMNRAGAEAGVGVWRLRLGRTAEGRTALRDAESRFLSWLEVLETDDRAREAYFRSGGWLGLYRRSVVFGWRDVEARLGAIGTDPHDGGMVAAARPWVRTALAMTREDSQELSAAVSELKAVPDEEATRDKWFPGVGVAMEALLGGDQASLGPLLGPLFRRHAELLKRGSLSDAGLETQEPEVLLALARRQGLEPVVDATDRSIQLRQKVLHVTEWEGQPVGPTEFHVQVDLTDAEVPWRVADKAPPAPRGRKSKLASEVSEEVVRSSLATQAEGIGPVWNRASAAFVLGDVAMARQLLVTEMAAARDRAERERLASGQRNVNQVLEHLSLAVAVGGPSEVADAAASLRRLSLESPGIFGPSRYSMAQGYIVLIADVLDGLSPGRNEALGLAAHLRRAGVSLLERDEKALSAGLDDVLREHVKRIDRKYPGATPLCVEAVHFAAAARRFGLSPAVDPSFRSYPVPILVTNVAGHEGKVGRVPLDLLGEALWDPDATSRPAGRG